jgi:hypothetical protein
MDGWDDRYLAQCQVLVLQECFQKMEESAERSTRRVLPWHGKSSEYLEGTTEKMKGGHV